MYVMVWYIWWQKNKIKLPLYVIWGDIRYHMQVVMTPISGMLLLSEGFIRLIFRWLCIQNPDKGVILYIRGWKRHKNTSEQRTLMVTKKYGYWFNVEYDKIYIPQPLVYHWRHNNLLWYKNLRYTQAYRNKLPSISYEAIQSKSLWRYPTTVFPWRYLPLIRIYIQ